MCIDIDMGFCIGIYCAYVCMHAPRIILHVRTASTNIYIYLSIYLSICVFLNNVHIYVMYLYSSIITLIIFILLLVLLFISTIILYIYHTYIYIYIHTYIHTYIYIYIAYIFCWCLRPEVPELHRTVIQRRGEDWALQGLEGCFLGGFRGLGFRISGLGV